ncbi:MAG: hypothetical protein ACPHWZ_02690 [Longimicrobiales bacterium]
MVPETPQKTRHLLATMGAVFVVSLGVFGLRAVGSAKNAPVPDEVTWANEIGPIIARTCLDCHGEDPLAPFTLLTFEDAAERVDRIVRVTSARRMPPWLPLGEHGTFAGERLLTDREVELFRAWAEGGARAGSEAPEALVADVDDAWQPGEPDLVVTLPTYQLAAEGYDVYRNLVVEIPVEEARWVEYVELRPGNRTAVHHARMMVDVSSSSRELDREDSAPGFDGMELTSNATNPDGHFIGWTPGKTRLPPLDGMAWRLEPGTDLVVQLHLRTSGEPQEVTAQVEFHFADEPPRRRPAILVVSSLQIDIPAGASDYSVSNSFTLPVDVDVLSVYPHAHYLGKDLRATALLPNGREVPLIHIPDWDFNWQDDYRFAEPISLPAGTTILKEFTFDNSAGNPHNPVDPPKRVVYGSNSDDEMADLILQVLPRNEDDRNALVQAQAWQHEAEDMAYMAELEYGRGVAAADTGELDAATRHFQESLQYRADHVGSLVGLAEIFVRRSDAQSALIIARQGVLMSNRQDARALAALAMAQALAGSMGEARATAIEAMVRARATGDEVLLQAVESRVGTLAR